MWMGSSHSAPIVRGLVDRSLEDHTMTDICKPVKPKMDSKLIGMARYSWVKSNRNAVEARRKYDVSGPLLESVDVIYMNQLQVKGGRKVIFENLQRLYLLQRGTVLWLHFPCLCWNSAVLLLELFLLSINLINVLVFQYFFLYFFKSLWLRSGHFHTRLNNLLFDWLIDHTISRLYILVSWKIAINC